MKTIEQLGVSPAPWKCAVFHDDPTSNGRDILDATGSALGNTQPTHSQSIADARLIAAAPDLYEALREAVIEACHECDACDKPGYRKCRKADGECFVQRWRKTLEKAGGAE